MQKVLNPELFGSESDFLNPSHQIISQGGPISYEQIKRLEDKFSTVLNQVNELKNSLTQLKLDHEKLQKNYILQNEQITRAIKILEKNDQTLVQQNQQKINHFNQKLADFKTLEEKTQHTMNRHQMLLKNYEVKLEQMNQLIEEKNNQILSFNSTLNLAKEEIARLKKA